MQEGTGGRGESRQAVRAEDKLWNQRSKIHPVCAGGGHVL